MYMIDISLIVFELKLSIKIIYLRIEKKFFMKFNCKIQTLIRTILDVNSTYFFNYINKTYEKHTIKLTPKKKQN